MTEKREILEELRRSRVAIARDTTSIASELDLVSKLRRSVTTRPFAWLGSAAAFGYILAGPKTRKPARSSVSPQKDPKSTPVGTPQSGWRRGFQILFQAAKFLLPIVRPALSAYAAQRIGDLSSRISR